MIASKTYQRLASSSSSSTSCLNKNIFQCKFLHNNGRRIFSTEKENTKETASVILNNTKPKDSWWTSAEWWGRVGAIAGWGMSASAIYDAQFQSPDIISMNMTSVLIVYSSLFARWAWIVKPQNLLLASCHVTNVAAQLNQLRRALNYKLEQGHGEDVEKFMYTAAAGAAGGAVCVVAGPVVRSKLIAANLGLLTTIAAAEAGEFL